MVQFEHHKNMHVKSPSSPNSTSSNSSDRDNLILTRKGGGSIIDHRPLFSNDGETLYVIWKHAVRAYSTQTGDFVRELEPVDQRIADIISHPDSINTIVGCTDIGEIHFWNCQSGIITKKLKLQFNTNEFTKVRTFHIVKYKTAIGNEVSQIVLTYAAKCYKKIYVLLFDIESGRCCKSTHIFVESPKYYVDVIGNQGNNLIALLHDSDLHILNPACNLVDKLHKTGKTGRMPTCIAGHPEDECVATGDSTGRVVVWRSLFQTRPYTAVYHWHTLPVTEIVFSKSGAQMYTGGGECVLVKWILANPHEKSFLPRLPAPIKHLTIAPDNLYVAVSTLDNGILIVNPQRKVTSVIQNFTWGISLSYKDMFPAGLTIDPRTNSLVLNSRTGHVQFYSTHTKSLLYNINITGQNFITQERNVNILNTEVTKIALNHTGTWMATVEERNDRFSHAEVRLKFWIFDFKKQLFTLNTSIELPHEEGVSALQFQPTTVFGDEDHLAVTVGKDKRFKLWNLAEPTSIHRKTRHWYCYSTGDYRNLNATDAGFSVDGSLLGVGFESTLTIWEPDTCSLKRSLTHSQYPYQITRIEFGKHETCNLIVVASSEHIAVWNILSLNITWSVPLKTSLLAADPKSVYMAVFTSDNTLHVFTPQSSSPVYTKKRIIENGSSVLGAVFVPHLQESNDSSFKPWQKKSQLYFIDSNQELLTLEPESGMNDALEVFSIKQNVPMTAFSHFVAAKTVFNKEENASQIQESLNILRKTRTEEFFSAPAHTLPPMKMLCSAFIMALLANPLSRNQAQSDSIARNEHVENSETTDDEDERDKKNTTKLSKRELSPIPASSDTEEQYVQLTRHNWDFLCSILPNSEGIEQS